MIRFTRAQAYPIGLDIGHDSIKMLQLEQVGDHLTVLAAAQQALTAEARSSPQDRLAASVEVIRQMFRQGKFHGRSVVVPVPREMLQVKNLRLPVMPVSDLPAVVQFEAKNVFPTDISDATIRFIPAGEVRHGNEVRQEVIVLAARNTEINGYLETLHHCGAIVEGLDIEACALYRTVDRFIRRREDEQEVHVLVDVGAQRSQVVIGKGREISFVKVIDLGGRNLQDAVSRKLGITLEEAQGLRRRLCDPTEHAAATSERDPVRQAAFDACRAVIEELGREISLCLRYYLVTFRGQRPSRLRLLGGEASDPQLQALLNSLLTIPVEVGRPLLSVDTSRMKPTERRGTLSEWAMALGLSLRMVQGTFGARDGKPRDPLAPIPEPVAPEAAASESAGMARVEPAAAGAGEVVHA